MATEPSIAQDEVHTKKGASNDEQLRETAAESLLGLWEETREESIKNKNEQLQNSNLSTPQTEKKRNNTVSSHTHGLVCPQPFLNDQHPQAVLEFIHSGYSLQ